MSDGYLPSRSARMLGVSRSTLRRYADVFAEFLPDYSRPRRGDRRVLSDGDLRTLSAILDLHKRLQFDGTVVSREDLLDLLRSPDGPQLVVPAALPTPPPEGSPEARTAGQEAQDGPAPLVRDQSQTFPAKVVDVAALLGQVDQLRQSQDDQAQALRQLAEVVDQGREERSAQFQLDYTVKRQLVVAVFVAAAAALVLAIAEVLVRFQ